MIKKEQYNDLFNRGIFSWFDVYEIIGKEETDKLIGTYADYLEAYPGGVANRLEVLTKDISRAIDGLHVKTALSFVEEIKLIADHLKTSTKEKSNS